MSDWQLKTPVAFLIFNRPDTTARVFAEIAQARPPRLLVVGDGPRAERTGEAERIAATRAIIDRVDWPCEVSTHFSEINLGCKKRVSSGIDWIFEQVEEAIILEDDCLPHPTFFRFCEELLEKYRKDERIAMICGTNMASRNASGKDSYYFSSYPHIWGWASWRRSWKNYDVHMKRLPELLQNRFFMEKFESRREYRYWSKVFLSVFSGKVDTWDAQVCFMAFHTSALSIFPNVNLVSNIGFGIDATHTFRKNGLDNLPTAPIQWPLTHPELMAPNLAAESERKNKEGIGASKWMRGLRYLLHRVGLV